MAGYVCEKLICAVLQIKIIHIVSQYSDLIVGGLQTQILDLAMI